MTHVSGGWIAHASTCLPMSHPRHPTPMRVCTPAQGWNVYAGVRSASAADDVAALHPRVEPLFLDVTSDADVGEAAKRVAAAVGERGGLDALVCNAGLALVGPLEAQPAADVQRQLDVNTLGPLRCIQVREAAHRAAAGSRPRL